MRNRISFDVFFSLLSSGLPPKANDDSSPYFKENDLEAKLNNNNLFSMVPTGIYKLKVNKNTRTRCEICSKLTVKTPERRQWSNAVKRFVGSDHISHLVLVFLLLNLNM